MSQVVLIVEPSHNKRMKGSVLVPMPPSNKILCPATAEVYPSIFTDITKFNEDFLIRYHKSQRRTTLADYTRF